MEREEIIQVKEVLLEPDEYEVLKILVKGFASGAEDSGLSREQIKEQLADLISLVLREDLVKIETEVGLAPGTLTAIRVVAVKKVLDETSGSITVFRVKKE